MVLRSIWSVGTILLLLVGAGCDWLAPAPTSTPVPSAAPAPATPSMASASPSSSSVPESLSATRPRGVQTPGSAMRGDVNLSHLNFLVEPVDIAGQPMAITHIYSEYPRYEWVDASGEGIAAVDDAARAAIVYLTDYERTAYQESLDRARRLLNFAMYMQAEDGQFYNFITDRAGTINKTGNTSYKSSGWWAARAAWALGAGFRVLKGVDPAYAVRLQSSFTRIRDVWAREMAANYGKYSTMHGVRVPGWLIGQGADVTSIAVLALLEYDEATGGGDAPTRDLLSKLCEALAAYQHGDARNYPWGMHPDSAAAPFSWHAWGSTQALALARAGQQLGRSEWVQSAKREADTFFVRLLAGDMVAEWGVLPFAYPQIAYGVNSITQGLLALHRATGDDRYGVLAGLAAGWFYGNNSARFPMYDPTTGRGYDGLQGPSEFRVNRNAGAESTIEALMALQAVSADPVAARYVHYIPAEGVQGTANSSWQVLEAENAKQTSGQAAQSYRSADSTGEARWSNGHYVSVGPNDAFTQEFSVPQAGQYYLYAAYMRQSTISKEFEAEALHAPTPPTIDGELSEWALAQPISVTSSSNILRGAAGWGGPDMDAFVGYLMWDEQNLYVAARVFDPEHNQTETGPSVWKGDALWLYLDTNRDRSILDVKLTLAQTPQGPQVWNWKASNYVRDARLAWKQGSGFYVYEAALPWKALGVSGVQAGMQMGLEMGRGCCGSGFQDISGRDPDVARNLVRLTLVERLSSTARTPQGPSVSGPDAVAISWNLDGAGERTHSEGGSPDRDYLYLERLNSAPVELAAGVHRLDFQYAGADRGRAALLDGFLLMPARLSKTLLGPGGRSLTLTYDITTGQFSIQER